MSLFICFKTCNFVFMLVVFPCGLLYMKLSSFNKKTITQQIIDLKLFYILPPENIENNQHLFQLKENKISIYFDPCLLKELLKSWASKILIMVLSIPHTLSIRCLMYPCVTLLFNHQNIFLFALETLVQLWGLSHKPACS